MAEATHILVVDDDARVRRLLNRYLSREGFTIVEASNGVEMHQALERDRFALILLDLMLPGEDGLSLARDLRAQSDIPIIMLTGKGKMVDRVIGLEMGADDYIAKPFHLREVLARIRSVLRRRGHDAPAQDADTPDPAATGLYEFDGWRLDEGKRALTAPDGTDLPLTTGEFDLLSILARNAGRVLNRDQLMDQIKGREWTPYDRSIDTQVRRLRKKIEADPAAPEMIKTVRGVGYVFTPKVDSR